MALPDHRAVELPLNLCFGPLVSALAAGNTVILKPSEMTPSVSAVMAQVIADTFPSNEVALFEGSLPTSTALLELPFDHIFFTGPAVGGGDGSGGQAPSPVSRWNWGQVARDRR